MGAAFYPLSQFRASSVDGSCRSREISIVPGYRAQGSCGDASASVVGHPVSVQSCTEDRVAVARQRGQGFASTASSCSAYSGRNACRTQPSAGYRLADRGAALRQRLACTRSTALARQGCRFGYPADHSAGWQRFKGPRYRVADIIDRSAASTSGADARTACTGLCPTRLPGNTRLHGWLGHGSTYFRPSIHLSTHAAARGRGITYWKDAYSVRCGQVRCGQQY